MRKYGLPLFAALGVIGIIAAVVFDSRPDVVSSTAAAPPANGFAASVSGSGIVEPLGGSVAVGTPVAGIVTAVEVRPGDKVKAGGALFHVDDGDLQAQRPALAAAESEARERLAQADELYRLALGVPDKRAVSEEEIMSRRSAVKLANASLASSRARLKQVDLEAARRTVRARVAGEVLQVNLRPGEFAQSGAGRPLILMTAGVRLAVRVDIDEFEAGRVRPGAAAIASPRGRPALRIPLTFERIEPAVVAKASLSGSGTERIDSRVLQVIYSFAPAESTALVGQQMDVTIEASDAGTAR